MAKRTTYLLYIDHLQATLPLLTMEERGELLTALTQHAIDPEAAPLFSSDRTLMAYNIMAGAMDASFEKYDKTVEKRRAAAQARYNNDANASKSMHMHANAGDTDTDTDTVTGTDTKTVTGTVTDTDTDTLYEGSSCKRADAQTTTTRSGAFKRPSLDQVRAYCESEGYSISPEAFMDYYEANGWKVGRASMKDWKAAVRTWARKEKAAPKELDLDEIFKGLD